MRCRSVLWAVLMCMPAALALAGEAVPTRIVAVTVHPDGATVIREGRAELPAGPGVVTFAGIPDSVLEASVRLSAEATMALTIASVDTRWEYNTDAVNAAERRLLADIEALEDHERALTDDIQAVRDRLAFIQSVAKAMPDSAKAGMLSGPAEQWAQAWNLIGEGSGEAYAAIQRLEIERRGVARATAAKREELDRVRTGRTRKLVVSAALEAAQAGTAAFRLTYRVDGASWRPAYDLRLDTEGGRLELLHAARVRQRTGADWDGVALTLSTTSPASGAAMPEVVPWWVDFPRADVAGYVVSPSVMLGAESAAPAAPTSLAAEAARKATVATARTVAGEFAAEYAVPGRQTVPADDAPHRYGVAGHGGSAAVSVSAYPAAEPRGYVHATWRFDGAAPLLPGDVTLFRDGNLVGTGAMPLVRPGEEVAFSFGVDDRVQVRYEIDTQERGRGGLFGGKRTAERRYLMRVTNHHGRPLEVTLFDRLPVPQDQRIEVRLDDRYTTPPATTDDGDRKGVLSWSRKLAAGEGWDVRLGYRVSYPAEQTLPGF